VRTGRSSLGGRSDLRARSVRPGNDLEEVSERIGEVDPAAAVVAVDLAGARLHRVGQFGLDKKAHLAGAHQELEPLEGLPPEARIGTWVMEWYWNQPRVPHVAEFVEAAMKRTARVPTARVWFGYAAVWTCALGAAKSNSLKAADVARALQDFHLPPEIALSPNPAFYRAGQNQLLASLYVGEAQASGSAPDDLFKVAKVVNSEQVAGTVEESGCRMTWPT
jgi:branched-chain amino acid transport system substrate-binding protein